jgi:hypothetical protein
VVESCCASFLKLSDDYDTNDQASAADDDMAMAIRLLVCQTDDMLVGD